MKRALSLKQLKKAILSQHVIFMHEDYWIPKVEYYNFDTDNFWAYQNNTKNNKITVLEMVELDLSGKLETIFISAQKHKDGKRYRYVVEYSRGKDDNFEHREAKGNTKEFFEFCQHLFNSNINNVVYGITGGYIQLSPIKQ